MRIRRRIRKPHSRRAPKVRRSGNARDAGKDDGEAAGALMIGGAKDPAEVRADARAARSLSANPVIHRKCAACESEDAARRSPASGIVAPGAAAAPAPKAAETAVKALGRGRPLSTPERAFYEPRLGADFSAIRLHKDAAADRAAKAIDAEAFTLGNDISFARGALGGARGGNPSLMAHELAHAAENQPVARRRIASSVFAPSLVDPLYDEYGANFIAYSETQLESPFTETSGPIPRQIVQNMMLSERVFNVDGDNADEVMLNLEDHVIAREGIIEFARNLRTGYAPDNDIEEYSWDKFSARLEELKADEFARLENIYKGVRLKAEKAQVEGRAMFDILNRSAEAGPTDRENDFYSLLWVIERSDTDKPGDLPDEEYRFRMNCLFASLVVMFGGSNGQVAYVELDSPDLDVVEGVDGALKIDRTSRTYTDWIPGDWGYIEVIDRSAAAARGEEGENIIYLGDDLYWGHLPGDQNIRKLDKWMGDVDSWDGGARLRPIRAYPTNGLRDKPIPFIAPKPEGD